MSGQCCDPDTRQKTGHHAPTCKHPWGFHEDQQTALTVPCPPPRGCGRPAGQGCVTPQGYSSRPHRVRVLTARGGTPTPVNTTARPSHPQADILDAAVAQGGIYLLPGYNFAGVDRLRRTMKGMIDKGWLEFREHLTHECRYEITNSGRDAHARYHEWMNTGTPP